MKVLLPIIMFLALPLSAVEVAKADELDSILDYLVSARESELTQEAGQEEVQRTTISQEEKSQSRARLANPRVEQEEKLFEKAQNSVFETE